MNKNNLCEAEVRKNIVLVELGKPLTLPLAVLNENCEFRKVWEETYDKWHPNHKILNCLICGEQISKGKYCHKKKCRDKVKAHKKAYDKAYHQRPEVKAHRKAYYQKPEVKAHYKAYNKAHRKAYYQRPEVKARYKAYNQKPEVKARNKAYHKAYYQKKKENERKN